ncbi:MAG: hypothetical protein RBU29_11665, partial [bacterium]|nr:hypothetical protein [bacterium]
METSTLQFVIESCFSKNELQEFFPSPTPLQDAVEAILCEDSEGEALTQLLDQASQQQREKIRSMSPRELRGSLAIEFLEPGKRLGLILWALLRDDRLSARSLATQIVDSFPSHSASPQASDYMETDSAVDVVPMNSPEEESSFADEDLDVEDLLADLRSSEVDAFSFPEESTTPDFDSELTDLPETFTLETPSTDDVDTLLASLSEIDDENNAVDLDHLEEVLDRSLLDDNDLNQDLPTESADAMPAQGFLVEERVDSLSPQTNIQPAPEHPQSDEMIQLSGVEIRLSSLKKACENLFEEPVELVSDPNLIQNDQLVVVGKRCGVRILHGPHCELQPQTHPLPQTSQAVEVSSSSLQSAFSRIYGESVELVPDPNLLHQGTILLAGRKTGIALLQNPSISVTTPSWAPQSGERSGLSEELQDLKNRLQALEEIMAKGMPAIASPPEHTPPPPLPIEDEIVEEAISIDALESDELEPISIPQEGDEPPLEESSLDELDELDEDILAAIAEQEKADEKECVSIPSEVRTAEEFSDEFNLDEFTESLTETNPDPPTENTELSHAEPEESISPEFGLELDEINMEEFDLGEGLGDLDLEELDIEELTASEEGKQEGQSSPIPDIGEDELDLESLSLEELLDDESEGADQEQPTTQNELANLDFDLDLDVLAELDEEEVTFTPSKVFSGEQILLLGGDAQHEIDYLRIVVELGGHPEWYATL